MFDSILEDIKGQFRYGNMISRIILVNVFVFLIFLIVRAFSPGGGGNEFYQNFLSWFSLSSEGINLLKRPWSLFTHMFVHEGMWHLFWNMLILFWFGRIAGDLIGDKKVLPLYIMGGLSGALLYLLFAGLTNQLGIAYGASAAVMSFVVAAAFIAPEYIIHLILIGPVRLKYIALFLVLIDLVMIAESNNTGGRIAHLGGASFGALYVVSLRNGNDLTAYLSQLFDRMGSFFGEVSTSRPGKMKVVHKKKNTDRSIDEMDIQERIDAILDKINHSGYDSLTSEEKEFLYQASKK